MGQETRSRLRENGNHSREQKGPTYTRNGRPSLTSRNHGIEHDQMQILGLPVFILLPLCALGPRPIHHFIPGVLDPLGEPVEVGLGPVRALSHHAEDAIRTGGIGCRGLSGEEICRRIALRAQVVEDDVDEE